MRQLIQGATAIILATQAGAQSDSTLRLIPQPRELQLLETIALTKGVTIDGAANADDRFAASDLTDELKARHIVVGTAPGMMRISLVRASAPSAQRLLTKAGLALDSTMRDEGYIILPDGKRLVVIGASASGVFYGAQTVKQLVEGDGSKARLRLVQVRDWPAMRYRGFHDDLSRGPIPTLEFQKKQLREFATYKLNVYSPYYEHTLQYLSNPLPAPPGGFMSRADVRELLEYAKRYHIDVIPEQEAFGHLHHLLKWELYAPLAETPHGEVLAPVQPGSLQLIKQLFAEIDSIFPSRFIHLGADETFELGRGQTMDRVKTEGLGPVYLGFLKAIHDSLGYMGKRFLFWGDVAQNEPALASIIPKDMLAVAWEYGVQQSFDKYITPYRLDASMETWVAPGVTNWNRVYPNNDNALRNIQGFIRDGQKWGATGVLNTSWDDDGEAIFNQTWYGVLFGAAASWQRGESSISNFEQSFGRAFHGDTTGKIDDAQRKLAAAHAALAKAGSGDGSDYNFWLDPWSVDGQLAAKNMLPIAHDVRVLAESSLVLIEQARRTQPLRHLDALDAMELGARRMDWIVAKLQFADEVARMYKSAVAADTTTEGRRAVGAAFSDMLSINGRVKDLRDGYANLRPLYERAWLQENRPYWIENVLARYDQATQLWIERYDRIAAAQREWRRSRRVPAPESLGIP